MQSFHLWTWTCYNLNHLTIDFLFFYFCLHIYMYTLSFMAIVFFFPFYPWTRHVTTFTPDQTHTSSGMCEEWCGHFPHSLSPVHCHFHSLQRSWSQVSLDPLEYCCPFSRFCTSSFVPSSLARCYVTISIASQTSLSRLLSYKITRSPSSICLNHI